MEPEGAPAPLGRRTRLAFAACIAAVACWIGLDLGLAQLWPRPAGLHTAAELLRHAFAPALAREGPAPPDAPPLLLDVALATWRTVAFAAAGIALSILLSLPLLLGASDAFWLRALERGGWRATVARSLRLAARTTSAVLRSVHELLWAVLLLSAIGLEPATGVIAIALPFAGALARLGAELVDESDPAPGRALRLAGAGGLAEFALGRVTQALPDLGAYAFYRFECALRSAALLGFFGYDTLGLRLRTSFDQLHYGEFWTCLYALLALVLTAEACSAWLRRDRLSAGPGTDLPRSGAGTVERMGSPGAGATDALLAALDRTRPRARVRNALLACGLGLLACALAFGGLRPLALFSGGRLANLRAFGAKLVPRPLREGAGDGAGSAEGLLGWFAELWSGPGGAGLAALHTVQLSVVATFLAGLAALLLAPAADRRLAASDPYLTPHAPAGIRALRAGAVRLGFVLMRALPEYLLAYLALAALGRSDWAPVLALAVHNAGILGRLEAEVQENLQPAPLAALRRIGAGRRQLAHLVAQPRAAGRFLAFCSYRFETCLRESVALGLLGTFSLGYLASEARARRSYDEFAALLAIGALLVILGDLLARRLGRWLRTGPTSPDRARAL